MSSILEESYSIFCKLLIFFFVTLYLLQLNQIKIKAKRKIDLLYRILFNNFFFILIFKSRPDCKQNIMNNWIFEEKENYIIKLKHK